MGIFYNPFGRHEHSNYPGIVVPLASAQARSSSPSPSQSQSQSDQDKKSNPDEKSNEKSDEKSDDKSLDRSENGIGPMPQSGPLTIESLKSEIETDIASSGHDSAYDRKAKVINRAISDIGMGRYQWQLFALCGCGWLADNLWLQGIALTLTQLSAEFGVSDSRVRFSTCALFLGLCLGASFWGIASDVIGRRPAFNLTLLISGVFGLAAGGGPNWIGTSALYACLGLGVGGNLPVDGALFLEFLPFASGNLLTMLSVWWPIGNLIASVIAWGLVPTYSCESGIPACNQVAEGMACCRKEDNMGWRYLVLTLGAITFVMFIARFFLFHLFESPKFLLSRGRQDEAVAAVQGIAYKNKAKTWLTVDVLNEVTGRAEEVSDVKLSYAEIAKRTVSKFSFQRIAPLFATRRLGLCTVLIWFCWVTIGMAYPLFNAFLPQYFSESNSTYITYRNYAITSIVGVPGSILACYTVEIKYIGRKGTMAISTLITGVILFCFTAAPNSNIQLVCSCLEAFFQNISYGVLYAYTPEVFPAPVRGTGSGIASCLNRIAGLCAPLVAIYASGQDPRTPIYVSGALMLSAFVAMCFFPIETRGKQTL